MKLLLTAVGAAIVGSSAAVAQCPEAERAKLEEFDRAWGAATLRGDRAALQMLYADDYTGVTLIGTQGKAAAVDDAVAAAERNRATPQDAPRLTFDNYVISCTPTTATVTHRTVATTTVDGGERTSYSRSVHVLEKRGGRWQVVGNAGHALTEAALLQYMENDWNQAYKKRDAAWFGRNFANDATDVDPQTGAIRNKVQAIAAMKNDKTVEESIETSEMGVRVDGNLAVVTSVVRVRGRDEQGRPIDRRTRFTDTFVKRDGRWQVLATQGTPIR